jgi:hypothetical protein
MDLRSSDRLIIIVGAIILVVAAVAIYFYYIPTAETIDEETGLESGTFYVTWVKETGQTSIDGKAEKTYNDPFSVMAPPGSVLTNVDFRLNWEDDHVTGLIIKRFYDTLTAEISLEGGEALTDTSEGGCSNRSLLFPVYNMPMIESIEANDSYEAEYILNDMVYGQDTANFDVKVTVKTGEKIRRPLKYLMDKGNSFNFEIVYEYYYPMFEDVYEEPMEEEPSEDGDLGELFRSLGFGFGGMI